MGGLDTIGNIVYITLVAVFGGMMGLRRFRKEVIEANDNTDVPDGFPPVNKTIKFYRRVAIEQTVKRKEAEAKLEAVFAIAKTLNVYIVRR